MGGCLFHFACGMESEHDTDTGGCVREECVGEGAREG